MESRFLEALRCENEGRPPVWMMRQAGRYLPEYRKMREKHILREMFFTPELAAAVTKLPIDLIGFDAAILFSDITVIALSLGLKLDFQEGPVVEPRVVPSIVKDLPLIAADEALGSIAETVRILKGDVKVPLIGFCGGPFTVASYLIEKHSGQELPLTKKWMYSDPDGFEQLLEKVARASIDYLQMQERAGVDAVQIFDSWAHVLSQEHFERFCLPYLKRLLRAVKVPTIVFMRGASLRVEDLVGLKPSAISFDWQIPLHELRAKVPASIAVQGNFDPDLLYAPLEVIQEKVGNVLGSMGEDKGFIANLGHGVKPDVPVDAVRCFVHSVKNAKKSPEKLSRVH